MSDFVDVAQLNVKAGDGGAGSVAFRREAHVPRADPTAATAARAATSGCGRAATSPRCSRSATTRTARRTSGTHGSGKKKHGSAGADLVIDVPEGTTVRSQDGELLADLVSDGDRWLAARGGAGGRGNARFLSNARRAPSFAEQGEYGEERWLQLELKLLADAALVGFPNAGQVDADLGRQRGEAEDRRLPVHDARAEPRRRAVPRARVRPRRHSRAHRRRGRRQGPRPPVPAPRRTGARARAPARPRARRRTHARRTGSGAARRARPLPARAPRAAARRRRDEGRRRDPNR